MTAMDALIKANKTIDELRQQLAQREAEVASVKEKLKALHSEANAGWITKHSGGQDSFKHGYSNGLVNAYGIAISLLESTQPTSEAHDAKIWNEARQETIQEIMQALGANLKNSWGCDPFAADTEILMNEYFDSLLTNKTSPKC